LRKHLREGRVALLFGSEKRGLSNSDLSYCHWLLRIPTREEHGSMNLGQAVAVCLYELARTAAKQPARASDNGNSGLAAASAGQLDRLTSLLIELLRASGYLEQRASAAREGKLRRMVRRLKLSREDAEAWLGMLRQIGWKLNQK
jgi:tRNA/rRNA methyltransferase